jgi:hypothetical protein
MRAGEVFVREGAGRVAVSDEVLSVAGDIVEVETRYEFLHNGDRLNSRIKLRFAENQVLVDHILNAGLEVETIQGDWHQEPFDNASTEMIFVVRHATYPK